MDISAEITGIKYKPFLYRSLNIYALPDLDIAFSKDGTFVLNVNGNNQVAVSWWVSAKRTRSYPYGRVYDSLGFQGKRATIIPLLKDEGKDGDRDFLQWDTISLMSLLGIYTIVCFYSDAIQSSRYKQKITKQRFDKYYLLEEISKLLSYQSDALHWNLTQIDKAGEIGQRALESYARISKKLGVEMHSAESAKKRVIELLKGKEVFMALSRKLAKDAQNREFVTIQPKEKLSGTKGILTIKNYLGGYYYFTCDEVEINSPNIYLIEGKHSAKNVIPSFGDIKDGLLKMILFTNLENVRVGNIKYEPVPVLKLTSDIELSVGLLSKSQIEQLRLLKEEAQVNGFKVQVNDKELGGVKFL